MSYSITPPNFAADGGPQKNATAWNTGSLEVTDDGAGNVGIHSSASAGDLLLGANANTYASIVLNDAVITCNKPVNALAGSFIPAGQALTVANVMTATAGAPGAGTLQTFVNRNVSGFSDRGYVWSASAPQGSGPIPNPSVLPAGLYAVIAAAPGDGNIGAQVSALCYWTGTAWTGSGVSTTFTSGSPNCAIVPVAGSAQLSLGGVAVPSATVVTFRQLLATP